MAFPGQGIQTNSASPLGISSATLPQPGVNGSPQNHLSPSIGASAPMQISPVQAPIPLYPQPSFTPGIGTMHNNNSRSSLPPLRPVFGLALEDLLKRDGSAIPLVVYQCIQAVDLYGLEVEGIYRLSGSSTHVSKLRSIFDNGNVITFLCIYAM